MRKSDYIKIVILIIVIILFVGPLNKEPRQERITYDDNTKKIAEEVFEGKGTPSSPYIIRDYDDLNALKYFVNKGCSFANDYFYQYDDIEFDDTSWNESIGAYLYAPFAGNYNGAGHYIRNVNIISDDIAGLFGYVTGSVVNLAVQGDIIACGEVAGGVIGRLNGERALAYNLLNDCAVSGQTVGGVVGQSDGVIVNCYSIGELNGNVVNEVVAQDDGLRVDDEEDLNEESIVDAFRDNNKEIYAKSIWPQIVPLMFEGKGTIDSPYLLSDIDSLCLFRDLVNRGYSFDGEYVMQTESIDLESIDNWEPIGLFDSNKHFRGVYDGAGHVISNIYIDGFDNSGFFGVLEGTVMNLGIESGFIRGNCVGSIASHGAARGNIMILNCYNKASLYGYARAGGIADNFSEGHIMNCINYGEVYAEFEEGEIASYGGIITHCVLQDEVQRYNTNLVYRDNLLVNEDTDVEEYLNDYLNELANRTGYQRDNFVFWQLDDEDKVVLTEEYYKYVHDFFIKEIIIVAVIVVTLLILMLFYKDKAKKLSVLRHGLTTEQKIVVFIFGAYASLLIIGTLLGDARLFESFAWPDKNDKFMDLYNPTYTMHSGEIRLEDFYNRNTGGYPPVARFILWLFGKFIPRDTLVLGAITARTQTLLLYVILMILFVGIALLLIRNWKEKLFFFALCLSSPMLFGIERGNIVLLSFILTYLFVRCIDKRQKLLQGSAMLSLPLAAAIKIYPAIYGVVLLEKRRLKELFTLVFYGIVFFTVPFLFTGGLSSMMSFCRSLGGFVSSNQKYARFQLINFTNVCLEINELFGLDSCSSNVVRLILLLLVGGLLASIFVTNKRWKKLLAATLVLVLLPGSSVYYMAAFYAIPLSEFFVNEDSTTVIEKVMIVIMALMLFPPHFLCGIYGLSQERLFSMVAIMGVVLGAIVIIDMVVELIRKTTHRRGAVVR